MIRTLAPLKSSQMQIFFHPFIHKVLEQGLGHPARQNLLDMRNGPPPLEAAKEYFQRLTAKPFAKKVGIGVLSRARSVFTRGDHSAKKIPWEDGEAVVRVMIARDAHLESVLGAADKSVLDFVALTSADVPWFRLLHALEVYGVVPAVRESEAFYDVGGGRESFRELVVKREKLQEFRDKDKPRYNNALHIVEAAGRVDADAVDLLARMLEV